MAARETGEERGYQRMRPGPSLNRGSSLTPRVRSQAALAPLHAVLVRGSGPEAASVVVLDLRLKTLSELL